MATILEELKLRLVEAQKRLTETTQRLQQAQQAQQAAQLEFNIWNGAVQTETHDEQLRTEAANRNQLPLPEANLEPVVAEQATLTSEAAEPINQTEVVRELLRRHPGGMTPTDIWREVGGQFKYRAYLYSVLKRLRDRDEVVMRRKKYALKPQQEAPHTITLQ
jgi:hypothetical protein